MFCKMTAFDFLWIGMLNVRTNRSVLRSTLFKLEERSKIKPGCMSPQVGLIRSNGLDGLNHGVDTGFDGFDYLEKFHNSLSFVPSGPPLIIPFHSAFSITTASEFS